MSNYYQDQQIAFSALDKHLQNAYQNKTNISISNLVYEMTKRYPVSSKALSKQINLFAKSRGLKIVNDDELVIE